MGNLSIEMGIERTDIILVVVDVELRLSRIGVARFAVKDLELFGRYRGVKVLVDVTGAEFLRRIAVGTGTIFRAEVVEVVTTVAAAASVATETSSLMSEMIEYRSDVIVPIFLLIHPFATVAAFVSMGSEIAMAPLR